MNTMANTNDMVIEYQLRRVAFYWGYQEDERYVYYMFAPPWVKTRVNNDMNVCSNSKSGSITKRSSIKGNENSFRFALAEEKKPILYSK